MIMGEWKEYKMGEVAEIVTGYPFPSEKYEATGKLRVVRGENVTIGKLRWDVEKHWNLDIAGLENYLLRPDDIVIGMDGSRVGSNRALIRETDLPLILAQRVACLRAKNGFDSKYIWYTIFSDTFRKYVEAINTGTSIPHISQKQIAEFEIMCPSEAEQKRIAGVLSSLDDKIDLLHRENATLEALAETLFRHYFIENPNPDWKEGKLGDVCHYVTDKMEASSLTTISYISTENMLNDKQGVTEASSIPNDIRVTRYGDGDILLSNIRPYFKKIWLADRRGGCSNDVLCIRANEKEFDCFVYYTLRQDDFFDYVMLGSKGCKMPRGDKQHIMNWPICLPNVESLGVFNKPVYLMIQKIKSNQQQIQTLTTKRDTLLPRLMSGEVNVVAH